MSATRSPTNRNCKPESPDEFSAVGILFARRGNSDKTFASPAWRSLIALSFSSHQLYRSRHARYRRTATERRSSSLAVATRRFAVGVFLDLCVLPNPLWLARRSLRRQ